MGDFLTRLIDRSRGPADVVKPVVRPVFASTTAGARPIELLDHLTAGETASRLPGPAEYGHAAADTDSQMKQAEPPRHTFSLNQEASAIHADDHFVMSADSQGTDLDNDYLPAGKKAGNLSRSSDESKQELPSEREPVTSMLPSNRHEHNVQGPDHSSVSPAVLAYHLPQLPVQADLIRNDRSLSSFRNKVIRPEVNIFPLAADPLPAERGSSVREAASAPPTIRVTIGRIDVRAIMHQPPSPKRATPAAPKLTLEDYLKQQTGGRR